MGLEVKHALSSWSVKSLWELYLWFDLVWIAYAASQDRNVASMLLFFFFQWSILCFDGSPASRLVFRLQVIETQMVGIVEICCSKIRNSWNLLYNFLKVKVVYIKGRIHDFWLLNGTSWWRTSLVSFQIKNFKKSWDMIYNWEQRIEVGITSSIQKSFVPPYQVHEFLIVKYTRPISSKKNVVFL